jgi:hypothetical protein
MSFIEPFLLWLFLPFIVLPVIIHFVNRMRYQPLQWAAMEFLFKAKRSSTKFARLREILILACRCLALLFLAMTLGRPLSGGWLGSAFSGRSESIIILLDRSSSMSALDESGQFNKVQRLVSMIRQTADKMSKGTKFTVIDSGSKKPIIIDDLATLEDELLYGVTDSGSSMKDMLMTAYEYILSTNPGQCEVWLTSDLQRSNWQPSNQGWQTLNADFKRLKSKVTFRVLALSQLAEKNLAVTVKKTRRYRKYNQEILEATVELKRNYSEEETVQLTVNLNGVETARQVKMTQESLLFVHKFKLADGDQGGYGLFKIPDDRQPGDNLYTFAYGENVNGGTAVFSENEHAGLLAFAAAPPKVGSTYAKVLDESSNLANDLDEYSLVILDNPKLSDKYEKKLLKFIDGGGQLLVFPPVREGKKLLKFIELEEVETAGKNNVYDVASWDELQGPLADTLQGESLPVNKLLIKSRQLNKETGQVLASYSDGQPFLSRFGLGKGAVYYCSSSIAQSWSDLYKGPILLPMLSRLVQEGSKKFSSIKFESCKADDILEQMDTIVGDRSQASQSLFTGVYKRNNEVMVFNRPSYEDDQERVSESTVEELFAGLRFSMFMQDTAEHDEDSQSELFTLFAVLVLLFLVIEGFLTLRRPLPKEVTL